MLHQTEIKHWSLVGTRGCERLLKQTEVYHLFESFVATTLVTKLKLRRDLVEIIGR